MPSRTLDTPRVYASVLAYFSDHEHENQGDVARELGISPTYLSMLKWGQRQPELDLALRMSKRFGVPLESLLKKSRQERRKAS